MQNIIFEQNIVFRKYTLDLVSDLDIDKLHLVPPKMTNSIIWNVGHLLLSQQMLTYGLSGLPLHTPMHWLKLFKIGSSGTPLVSQVDINSLFESMVPLIEQTKIDFYDNTFQNFKPFHTGYGAHITNINEALAFNNYHEGNHIGHIITLKKLV